MMQYRFAVLAALIVGGVSMAASAQTTSYYGSAGQYLGQATTRGGTTNYYGSAGEYLGNTTTIGRTGTTNYWGPAGDYQGTSYGSYPWQRH